MFMTCCAADARPVATLFEIDQKPELPEMTWVKVTGTATFPIENGRAHRGPQGGQSGEGRAARRVDALLSAELIRRDAQSGCDGD